MVTLNDANSFGGRGYHFRYAMPVTVRFNEPYKLPLGEELFTTTSINQDFCQDKSNVITDIRAIGKLFP